MPHDPGQPGGAKVYQYSSTHFGLFEGVVTDTDDPLNRGRVKLKVSNKHDLRESVTTWAQVDWAEPCMPSGSFLPPLVGDTVWVMFRQGHINFPVYLGIKHEVYQKHHAKARVPTRDEPGDRHSSDKVLQTDKIEYFAANNKRVWWAPPGNSTPRESWRKSYYITPEIYVIHRSPRGSVFYVEDTPRSEETTIIDRGGQIFKMECKMIEHDTELDLPVNDYNMARRLDRTSERDKQLTTINNTVNLQSSILLSDLLTQRLQLIADVSDPEEGGTEDGSIVYLKGEGGYGKIRERGGRTPNKDDEIGGPEIRLHCNQESDITMDYGIELKDKGTDDFRDYIDIRKGVINVEADNRIFLKVHNSEIEMTRNNINISADNVGISALYDVAISAGETISISAGDVVDIDGGTITLN